jgi:Flp pilus assembly protein TadG
MTMPNADHRRERGQTTVELALCLPFVILVIAVVIEAGMVGADQVRLWHAARETARIAAVDGDLDAIREGTERSGLDNVEITVEPVDANRAQGAPVRVDLVRRAGGHVPFADLLLSHVIQRAHATMRIEQP